jgi:hypothetical protein
VAGDAGRTRQVKVTGLVTIRAQPRRNCVQSSQGEAGGIMIELRIGPLHGIVTLFACRRETRVRHRARRVREVSLMA